MKKVYPNWNPSSVDDESYGEKCIEKQLKAVWIIFFWPRKRPRRGVSWKAIEKGQWRNWRNSCPRNDRWWADCRMLEGMSARDFIWVVLSNILKYRKVSTRWEGGPIRGQFLSARRDGKMVWSYENSSWWRERSSNRKATA